MKTNAKRQIKNSNWPAGALDGFKKIQKELYNQCKMDKNIY